MLHFAPPSFFRLFTSSFLRMPALGLLGAFFFVHRCDESNGTPKASIENTNHYYGPTSMFPLGDVDDDHGLLYSSTCPFYGITTSFPDPFEKKPVPYIRIEEFCERCRPLPFRGLTTTFYDGLQNCTIDLQWTASSTISANIALKKVIMEVDRCSPLI
jgi:hypothetical protein